MLVVHGSITVKNPPKIDNTALKDWFQTRGNVEGIVWHCPNKSLFKVKHTVLDKRSLQEGQYGGSENR